MIGYIIFCLMFLLPPMILGLFLAKESEIEEKEKNRILNSVRYVKTDYELDAFDFVENEKIRLENEHKKRLKKITKKYGNNILLGVMSPDDLDAYMREQSYYLQKVKLLDEGLMSFYKNK